MVLVDLNTRIIPRDQGVVVARPGAHYYLAGVFIEGSLVGPDLPDLEWSADDPRDVQVAKIKRSVAVRNWHRRGRPEDGRPPNDLAEYDGFAVTDSVRQLLRVVRYYFEDAKQGDIVVLPQFSFNLPVYIGEYTGRPSNIVRYRVPHYEGSFLYGRRVQWLGSLSKNSLPGETLEALKKPTALVALPRSFFPTVYREAYRNWSEDTRYVTEFNIKSERYTLDDDMGALGFFKLISYNYRETVTGSNLPVSIKEAAFLDLGGYAPALTTEINSPGYLTLASQYIIPLVAAAMFALAVHVGVEAYAQVEAGTLTIGNSAAPEDDPCALRVQQQIYDQMILLGYERWAEACELARATAERTGMDSNARVKDDVAP